MMPAVLTALTLLAEPVAPATGLRAASPDRDAGAVAEGDPIALTYTLTNHGPAAVRLLGVEAGCACQSAAALPEALPPGRSAELSVVMNTRGRTGRQRGWWAVTYRAAGAEPGTLRLSVTATVTAAGKLEPTPPVAQFGAVERGEPVSATVVLAEREPSGEAVSIREVRSPDWLAATVERAAEGPPRFRLTLTGTPPGGPGRVGGAVKVFTDHPRYPLVEVPFEAFIHGSAEVTPRSLVQIVGTAPRPTVLTVRGRGGAAVTGVSVEIVPADGPPRPVSADAVSETGGAWTVRFPPPPADGPRVERATVRLTVAAGGDQERHELPMLVLRPDRNAAD